MGFSRTDSMLLDRFCKLVLDRSVGVQMGQPVHVRSRPCPLYLPPRLLKHTALLGLHHSLTWSLFHLPVARLTPAPPQQGYNAQALSQVYPWGTDSGSSYGSGGTAPPHCLSHSRVSVSASRDPAELCQGSNPAVSCQSVNPTFFCDVAAASLAPLSAIRSCESCSTRCPASSPTAEHMGSRVTS